MISVSLSYKPDDQVILVSEQGYGLMYPVEQIPLVSNKSKGVKAMNLSKDDCVASICVSQNREEQVLISTTTLSLKRMKQTEIAPLNRPAKGNRICETHSNLSTLPSGEENVAWAFIKLISFASKRIIFFCINFKWCI